MWECALSLLGPRAPGHGLGGYCSGPGGSGAESQETRPVCLRGDTPTDGCLRGLEGRLPPALAARTRAPPAEQRGSLTDPVAAGWGRGAERWQTPTQAAAGCQVNLERNAYSLSSLAAPRFCGIELLNFIGECRRWSLVLECAGGFKPRRYACLSFPTWDRKLPPLRVVLGTGPVRKAGPRAGGGPPPAQHRAGCKGGVPVKARGGAGWGDAFSQPERSVSRETVAVVSRLCGPQNLTHPRRTGHSNVSHGCTGGGHLCTAR